MINQEIKEQLKSATSADNFTQICDENSLKYRGANGLGFTIFAYEEDGFSKLPTWQ